jgi:hypothetical protein
MILMLKRDAGKRKNLARLLGQQQDRHSGKYHKWITPEEFGAELGADDVTSQKIVVTALDITFLAGEVMQGGVGPHCR